MPSATASMDDAAYGRSLTYCPSSDSPPRGGRAAREGDRVHLDQQGDRAALRRCLGVEHVRPPGAHLETLRALGVLVQQVAEVGRVRPRRGAGRGDGQVHPEHSGPTASRSGGPGDIRGGGDVRVGLPGQRCVSVGSSAHDQPTATAAGTASSRRAAKQVRRISLVMGACDPIPPELLIGPSPALGPLSSASLPRCCAAARFVRVYDGVWRLRDHVMSSDDQRGGRTLALPADARLTGITRIQLLGLDFGPRSPAALRRRPRPAPRALPEVFLHRTVACRRSTMSGWPQLAAFVAYCAGPV